MPLFRSDQALIHVSVVGVTLDKEPWSVFDGADNAAESAQFYPGGMKPLIAGGGFPKPSALTVERPWSDTLMAVYKKLWALTGQAEGEVTYQLLNANKEPVGEVATYTGVLSSTTRPNYKAGTSEEARLKLMFDLDGEVG